MFAPPPVIETRVFARIPEKFWRPDDQNIWTRVQFHGMSTPTFLEGPSFDRDGNLWVGDIPWGRLFKITPDGTVTVELEYEGEPNGLCFHKDGRLFIADHAHGIMVFDPRTGAIEPHLTRDRLERFKGVNDLTFASNGDLYFTDQGQTGFTDPTGRLYCLRANGDLELLMGNIPSPNGLVLSDDEHAVFLAVTRDNAIWRIPVLHNYRANKAGRFIQMSGGNGPDGMAADARGNLVVCHVGFGAAWVFSPRGEPIYRIDSCEKLLTTNCCYGGPGNRTLYITESATSSILMAELPEPGRLLYSHM